MTNITWDESLSVDVDEIDEDHRRLVDLFNILSQAVADGEQSEYIDAVLEELISCTVWHFRHEERLMILFRYDGYADHRAEHEDLIKSVRDLQQKFHQAERQLTQQEIEYLSGWLTGHILGRDMKLGFFLMDLM